jgi:hypothetical protein
VLRELAGPGGELAARALVERSGLAHAGRVNAHDHEWRGEDSTGMRLGNRLPKPQENRLSRILGKMPPSTEPASRAWRMPSGLLAQRLDFAKWAKKAS